MTSLIDTPLWTAELDAEFNDWFDGTTFDEPERAYHAHNWATNRMIKRQIKEQRLREQFPSLAQAWDDYTLLIRMCESEYSEPQNNE
jgi:hypothetical protein